MTGKTLLVTVGSTLFGALTDLILSTNILFRLPSLGVSKLVVQYGSADLPTHTSKNLEVDAAGAGSFICTTYNGDGEVAVQVMRYTKDFAGLVGSADAIISHAGELQRLPWVGRSLMVQVRARF
jgi:beta-1,4-N-acetylglucosaminyltransferase